MLNRIILFLLLLGCCACRDSSSKPAQSFLATLQPDTAPSDLQPNANSYFPQSFSRRRISCGLLSRSQPILSTLERDWYSSQLKAADEPKLYPASLHPVRLGRWTLRFTWLRSFHPPVIIRVEGEQNSQMLVAKQLSGAGGYGPGKISLQTSRWLNRKETELLQTNLLRSHVFDLPPKQCDMGLDGAEWLIEGVDANGYHYVDRWSPQKGEVRDLGLLLLSMTGWQVKEIY